LEKNTGRGERIHYFQEVTMNSAELKLYLISEYNGIIVWGGLFSLVEGKS